MDSPDLDTLLAYFHEKIQLIENLLPLAKFCNNVCDQQTQQIDRITSNGHDSNGQSSTLNDSDMEESIEEETDTNGNKQSLESLADLSSLSEMVLEMKEIIATMNSTIAKGYKEVDEKRDRCLARIDGLREHTAYLQANFPAALKKSSVMNKGTKSTNANQREKFNGKPNGPPPRGGSAARGGRTNGPGSRPGSVNGGRPPTSQPTTAKKQFNALPQPGPSAVKPIGAPRPGGPPRLSQMKSAKKAFPPAINGTAAPVINRPTVSAPPIKVEEAVVQPSPSLPVAEVEVDGVGTLPKRKPKLIVRQNKTSLRNKQRSRTLLPSGQEE